MVTKSTSASTELELATRLRLAVVRTARRLRQEAGSELSPSQGSALAVLERHGPLSPSELAEREGVKRPTATRVIARLVEAGYAERTTDPSDKRCALVSVSAEGRATLKRIRARKTAYLAARVHGLDADDAAALERAADILERLLETEQRA